ncbi:hypothetical protein I5481_21075 [Citrobacter freundii]|nr:hypothetical protein [Citrobacter freundii]
MATEPVSGMGTAVVLGADVLASYIVDKTGYNSTSIDTLCAELHRYDFLRWHVNSPSTSSSSCHVLTTCHSQKTTAPSYWL